MKLDTSSIAIRTVFIIVLATISIVVIATQNVVIALGIMGFWFANGTLEKQERLLQELNKEV